MSTSQHNASPSSSRHDLFGGGLSISLPVNLLDASDLRQIPDTQEVWLSPDSEVTYIVEILESVESTDAEGVIKLHFDSLAHDNDALSSSISSTSTDSSKPPTSSPQQPIAWSMKGVQTVRKFGKEKDEHQVVIFLAVWRILDKNTDIVLTVNCPESDLQGFAGTMFDRAVAGFKVESWELFAN